MRSTSLLGLVLAACACAPVAPPGPPSAEQHLASLQPRFRTPSPSVFVEDVDLPLRPGDRVLADCTGFFADELPEMDAEDRREFEASVTCIYPPKDDMAASAAFYTRALQERGFQDESGTYVQSGMRIFCNRTHTLAISFKGKYVPSSFLSADTLEVVVLPGGGIFGHETLMFVAGKEPCERYTSAAGYSEPLAPDGYAAFPQPNFISPEFARMRWGDYELPLRVGDRLVSHCAQYYREEIGGNLPHDAVPEELARYNQTTHCVYPPAGEFRDAVAHYMSVLESAGYNETASLWRPNPDAGERFPMLRAGQQEWTGVVSRCTSDRTSVSVGAMARYGGMTMLDPLTGEYFAKRDPTGGRQRRLDGASFPHPVIFIRFGSFGC